ncbi:HHE domain-containing protein [Xylariaceae sp. FL0662B]|nr:HHE domain-containing protein [Xylariaceae sp. FL0662B]
MLRRSLLQSVQLRGPRVWLTFAPPARLGRPYSEQAVAPLSEVIKKDHRQLEHYHNEIISSKDPKHQRRYQNAFVWELARHAIAEELVVYPSLESGVSDGKTRVERDRSEHQLIKEQLYTFQNLRPEDITFIPSLESLMKDLRIHFKEEEEHDLVKLEEALLPTRSRTMAEQFEMTKVYIPTRSHPSAPNKPPFETAVGLMTAPLDKLQDIFREWPKEESEPKPSSKGSPVR